jgi:hypothetical protein
MNERLKALRVQAINYCLDNPADDENLRSLSERVAYKFAEFIIKECIKESMDEIVADEDLATETDPMIREYLLGHNQGIVDAVVRFRNHFGVIE